MMDIVGSGLVGFGFVLGAVGLVLGSYFLARRLLTSGDEGDRTHDAASTVAVRVAALHGLILALVYAQELDDYKGIRTDLTQEAVAISDVFNDAARYGGPIVVPVQQHLARYVALVVDEEWQRLAQRQGLSVSAWVEWDKAYNILLDLDPANDRQRYLAQHMRQRITDIAGFRQMREAPTLGTFAGLFWAPALIGLICVAAPFYVYRPTRTHIALLSMFGAYSGVILFFIFAFSNPFAAPGRLEPAPFLHLLKGDIGKALPTAK
ncbi:bestrophin-like domain [Rhizobium sp. SL42]|uniref:bestrophin-like domain n=1 Tax=Rhizobium sp. SL42 TaxID=2806346 RepID=UPI001F35110B|nr:DUF4239 domain-containing protein [Rhizobium sp. SL42]UJW74079.1 DUF4239 domain-containing protein [Rhizobium sp. SL42]